MGRNASGELYPTAGNYGTFAATAQSLGLPDSGRMTIKDTMLAAARLGQRGAPIPDVPIAEVQAMRGQQAAGAAAAAEKRKQAEAERQYVREREDKIEDDTRAARSAQELKRVEVSAKPAKDAPGIQDWEQSNNQARQDAQYHRTIRVALGEAQRTGKSDASKIMVGRTEMTVAQAKATLDELERAHGGGEPRASTYEEWKERQAEMGDPRFAGAAPPAAKSGAGIVADFVGRLMGGVPPAPAPPAREESKRAPAPPAAPSLSAGQQSTMQAWKAEGYTVDDFLKQHPNLSPQTVAAVKREWSR
jgi:hypothetical protein